MVETFPPIWQLPLAPRSKGMMKPRSLNQVSSSSSTQPASHVRMPETASKPSTPFIPASESTTSSRTGMDPPTRPVLPPLFFFWVA